MKRLLEGIENPRFRQYIEKAILGAEQGDMSGLEFCHNLREFPVSITEFIDSPKYMNNPNTIYPDLYQVLEDINSGDYQEAVLTGGIGTGKTTIALYCTAYQLYILSCMKSPHKAFSLDINSEIEFIFQSINSTLAKAVDYARFKSMIENSPYFNTRFMFDKTILSCLKFPNRIIVTPISGSEMGSIGQNVIGGVIDEVNFMAVVGNSKKTAGSAAGVYDQAVELYNSIARRRKTRFIKHGRVAGILCLVSSKRYPDQFTDKKEAEAQRELRDTGKTSIYVYDKRVWDIKPKDYEHSKWFEVFVGDITRKPFLPIDTGQEVEEHLKHLSIQVPQEYLNDFRQDIFKALRDIAGISTIAITPYITDVEALAGCFKKNRENIFTTDECDFVYSKVGIKKSLVNTCNNKFPRFAHVDLGLTSDNAGIAIGHVPNFTYIEHEDEALPMPNVVIDGFLRVRPPPNGEISFEKVRKLFLMLNGMGFPLKWITFDSYQSVDSIQILRSRGFFTGNQSMDKTTVPYDICKTAVLEGRISMPENPFLQQELARLERTHNGKIDHPPNGTKDLSDSLAGVVYGLTMQRTVWAMFGENPVGILTEETQDLEEKSNKRIST